MDERELRIQRVIHYLSGHPDEDCPTRTLAGIACYSPDHLHSLFKDVTGETPKQYSLRLRLEVAFHYLVVYPHRPVQDVGMDCGFSSPSVFSRAMKNYFGYSPEALRQLPHRQQMTILHGEPTVDAPSARAAPALSPRVDPPEIVVVRAKARRGIGLTVPFDDAAAIGRAFRELEAFARDRGMPVQAGDCYGILAPHQRNSYRVMLAVEPVDPYPVYEIGGGRYARFTVSGDRRAVNKAAHYFYRRWLPASGYAISGISGFETFEEDPGAVPYHTLQRQVHVPVTAAT